MDLKQLKEEAEREAFAIELNWEQLEDAEFRREFEQVLQKAVAYVPELESLYGKLTSGKSVVEPDKETELPFDDIEKYSYLVEDELVNGYVLAALYEKYTLIQNIAESDRKSPLDNQPPTDYI